MLNKAPSRSVNETVTRPREHLTEREIDRLMTTARQDSRYGHRDATAILVAYWHGLRASELCALEWDQIDLTRKTIRIYRAKGGDPATHYLSNSELRALRRLQRENPPGTARICLRARRAGYHGLVSQNVCPAWRAKQDAFSDPTAPDSAASCGYKFANEGKDTRSLQAYLGHRSINSTVRYTAMAPNRFRGWEKE